MKRRTIVSVILMICLIFSVFPEQSLIAYAGEDEEITDPESGTDEIRTGIGLEEGYEDDRSRGQ